MSDLVRARYKGTDHTMSRFFANRFGADIIQSPTHNPDGTRRGPTSADSGRKAKPKTTVKKAAAKKAVTESADSTKENDQ